MSQISSIILQIWMFMAYLPAFKFRPIESPKCIYETALGMDVVCTPAPFQATVLSI